MQMTSVLKRYSQLDERTRYMRVLADSATYKLLDKAKTGVVDITAVSSNGGPLLANNIVKDLGRMIHVYDKSVNGGVASGPHVATLREVQKVNGATSEGVGGTAANMFNSYWIATWTSSGNGYPVGVNKIVINPVARTG